jgi:formylglycine-generating enzyme required for sulfatase activity
MQPEERHSTNSIGMRLVLVPHGRFIMGSPSKELLRQKDERPHSVRITQAFYLGAHEVTIGQFRQFVEATGYKTTCEKGGTGGAGFDPHWEGGRSRDSTFSWRYCGFPQDDEHPVVNVSHLDALAFCEWLSRREGARYRLPTEAEWEYACRAGTMTPFWSCIPGGWPGESNVDQPFELTFVDPAILERDGFECTSPVGSFAANAFGLYDMHGNVQEWCADWYDAEYYRHADRDDPGGPDAGQRRVIRGGSFQYYGPAARSANRGASPPDYSDLDVGLRVVAEITSAT